MDRQYAKKIFVHYFQLLAERSGLPLDGECILEIEGAVEAIYLDAERAAKAEAAKAVNALASDHNLV